MVRVWDAVGEDMVTKGEYGIIVGRINDIAWDGDSQRIIAVGEGKERMGHCVTWDSGNSVGEISGHSSQINCVSIRQQRPLRAATGSDDTQLCFFHGAPFKFNTSNRGQHDRFVFGTQFAPDGNVLVSVGADKKIWLYDGKTGEPKGQIGQGVHTGSIFGVSFAKDSKKFVTASADQTVRVWDVEAGKNIQTWRMGEEGVVSVPDQQVGVVWPSGRSGGLVISVDLDGNLNYLNEGNPRPTKIVTGHQKSITAATIADKTFYTGSFEGRVRAWDLSTGLADPIDGDTHTNYVSGIASDASSSSDKVYTVGWDDTLRCISAKTFVGGAGSTGGQPKAVAAAQGYVYTATPDAVVIFKDNQKVGSIPARGATAIAAHGTILAVGHDDKSIKLFSLSSPEKPSPLNAEPARKPTAAISTLAFSPQGTYLATGTSGGKIVVYKTSDWSVATDRWSAHTARVTSLAWDGEEKAVVSGSLDTNVFLWSLAEPGRRVKAGNAHKDGVNGVGWVESGKVVSTGADGSVKVWAVKV